MLIHLSLVNIDAKKEIAFDLDLKVGKIANFKGQILRSLNL